MPEPHWYGLVLAGGRGTRFWPRSRRRTPKQVLNVFGERSLIQATVDRLAPIIAPERFWILTNEHVKDEILRQLPGIPAEQVIAEPAQRNTAPAIGLAAHVLRSIDPDAVMGVFPSDHVIGNPEAFREAVRAAFGEAEKGRIAVLGIAARRPETGFGYIEFPAGTAQGFAAAEVLTFREKPDEKTAAEYVASGRFFWNGGMFFWRADLVSAQLRRHLPKTAAILESLPPFRSPDFDAALAEAFPRAENISVDYAVLEKAKGVVGIPCPEFTWSDVGSWNAVYELSPHDAPNTVCYDAKGTYVDAGGKTVALLGVDDLIVVDTPDALLIARRDRAQEVGEIVKILERQGREDLL